MWVGAEKARYVCGGATAINNRGEMKEVNIDAIYKKAKSWELI